MTGARPGFEAELRRLRKGEALYAPDLLGRLGPTMRQLAGIAGDDDAPTARRKVAAWLTPDRFGDVRCVFRHLRQGLGHGVRWET